MKKIIIKNEYGLDQSTFKDTEYVVMKKMKNLSELYDNGSEYTFQIIYTKDIKSAYMSFDEILHKILNEINGEYAQELQISEEVIFKIKELEKTSFKVICNTNNPNISKYIAGIAVSREEELFINTIKTCRLIIEFFYSVQEGKNSVNSLKNIKIELKNEKRKLEKSLNISQDIDNLIKKIEFYLLCVEERLILLEKSEIKLSELREIYLKSLLKNDFYKKVALSFFLSSPLKFEIYCYLKVILRMVNIIDKEYNGDRKKFYEDFLVENKSPIIIGNGYLKGYRAIPLNVIDRFVRKYRNRNSVQGYGIVELYSDYFKSNQIYSLILIDYIEEKTFEYEIDVLYRNELFYVNGKKVLKKPYISLEERLLESQNTTKEIKEFKDDFLHNVNVKVDTSEEYKKIEFGRLCFVSLNIENIKNNIEHFKRKVKKIKEKGESTFGESYLQEKYLDCNLFLVERENSSFNKIVITCLNVKSDFYVCQYRERFLNNREEFFEIVLKEGDFEVLGMVLEIKSDYSFFNR